MDQSLRNELIATYRRGYAAVLEALDGATDAELDARPGEGEWTAHEIVHHLADSETTSGIRLRRLLAEDAPVIQGYDEEEFARRLHYDRPIERSLDLFRATRDATAEILDRMSENEWRRAGTHTESGSYSAEEWLEIYAEHGRAHAEQIRRARTAARL